MESSNHLKLQTSLGYRFQNPQLLEQALTHPSLAHDENRPFQDNQRLEYLGDAVLQLSLTHYLFQHFPKAREGELTQLRAASVNRQALADLAQSLELGSFLRLSRGEKRNGGAAKTSNLADAMEAVIGAIYLDSGFERARDWVQQHFQDIVKSMEETTLRSFNPKGDLQELLQGSGQPTPIYELVSEEGPDHKKSYEMRVVCNSRVLGSGTGASKKEAEAAAAMAALQFLQSASSERTEA